MGRRHIPGTIPTQNHRRLNFYAAPGGSVRCILRACVSFSGVVTLSDEHSWPTCFAAGVQRQYSSASALWAQFVRSLFEGLYFYICRSLWSVAASKVFEGKRKWIWRFGVKFVVMTADTANLSALTYISLSESVSLFASNKNKKFWKSTKKSTDLDSWKYLCHGN